MQSTTGRERRPDVASPSCFTRSRAFRTVAAGPVARPLPKRWRLEIRGAIRSRCNSQFEAASDLLSETAEEVGRDATQHSD